MIYIVFMYMLDVVVASRSVYSTLCRWWLLASKVHHQLQGKSWQRICQVRLYSAIIDWNLCDKFYWMVYH